MEQLAFLIAAAVVLVAVTLLGIRNDRAARARFKQKMRASFGKKPEKPRSPAEYDHIRSYFSYHKPADALDDITWNDLDMDAVYARVNYCRSAAGEALLYHMLRTPACPEDTGFEEQVSFFASDEEARTNLQTAFEDMRQKTKYSAYDHLNMIDRASARSNGFHFLMLLLIVCCIAGMFVTSFSGMLVPVLIGLIAINIVTYYREKKDVNAYLATFEYILRLLYGSEQVTGMLKKAPAGAGLSGAVRELEEATGRLQAFKRGSFLVMTQNSSSGNPLDILMDYLRMLTHVDLIKFNGMFRHLLAHVADVDTLIRVTGTVDARISVACLRASLDGRYCMPEEGRDNTLVLEDAYHPLVEDAVRNSITCEKNVLITGSNASGKSTFLKTVAICALLAQSIRTVPAKRYAAPKYRIFSSMALSDNLSEGDSYYMVEIKSLKRILDAAKEAGQRVLCFVDEVLRGTNTLERIAASAQVLKQFANGEVQCFAATHDGELTEILKDLYDNYHFDGDLTDGDVRFDYRLREGSAKTRNAIRLLQQIGYDDAIVKDAEKMAARFLETGVWTLS